MGLSWKRGTAIAGAALLLSACASGDNSTLTSVTPSQSSSISSSSNPAGAVSATSRNAVSALFQNDSTDITLDDVAILLAAIQRQGRFNQQILAEDVLQLLDKTLNETDLTLPRDNNSNFSTRSLVEGVELDLLDLNILYTAYILGIEDDSSEIIETAVESLLEGEDVLSPSDLDLSLLPDLTDQFWTLSSHGCIGNGTNDIHFDDRSTGYLGCGENTNGQGLFRTEDGGLTWNQFSDPNGFLDTMRVNTISRSDDGLLYVGGIGGGERVISINTNNNDTLGTVFTAGSTVDFRFTVGKFRRNADGFAIAESLTGNGVVFRTEDSNDSLNSWSDGSGWDDAFTNFGFQILDMVEFEGEFYASGSTISQPPQVFLPPLEGLGSTLEFVPVQLADGPFSGFDGEMWGIAVNGDGIVVGGVNQNQGVGVVFASNDDPYDASNWTRYNLSTLFPDDRTWVEGVCRSEGYIVAVGRFSQRDTGFVLISRDNAQTFEDITPTQPGNPPLAIPALYDCEAFDNGDIVVTGGGFAGVYAPF